MAWTDRYVSADASGGDGLLITTPWTLAEAITNAVAGMRFNVKAGTYAHTTTTLTNTVAGTAIAPIRWEGYNTTPGDIVGRVGIPASWTLAKPLISFTTGHWVNSTATLNEFAGINFTSAYVASAVGTFQSSGAGTISFDRCQIINTAANSNGRAFSNGGGAVVIFTRCYISATATADRAANVVIANSSMRGCSIRGGIIGLYTGAAVKVANCVVDSYATTGISTNGTAGTFVDGCVFYGGTSGILHASATASLVVENSIFHTCTNGINQSAGTNSSVVKSSGNAFYSVTNPIVGVQEMATAADDLYVARGNVTLAADPFVNAAGHDFTLTAASAARGAGIPGAFENESYSAVTDAGAVGGSYPIAPGAGIKRHHLPHFVGAG